MPRRVFAAAAASALLAFASASLAGDLASETPASVAVTTPISPPKAVIPPPPPKLTAAERCTSLEQQFAAAVLLHLTSKKLTAARKLAEDGTEDCTHKKYSLGTRRLVSALATLGVTPKL